MEVLVYGIVRSVTLLLMSVGFSFSYGVSRLPNFAHGAFYVLAGYLTWVLVRRLDLNYPMSICLTVAMLAAIGGLTYRLLLIRVRGMPVSEIIASYALGVAILESLRCLFSGSAFTTPVFVEGRMNVLGVPIDYQRLFIVGGGALVVLVIWLFTHYSKMGLSLRSVAQDERAALTIGVDSDRAATVSLAMGSSLAPVAGIGILPVGSIAVNEGYDVLIQALAVCVIGGLGSWLGTIAAAFLVGFAGIITATYIGGMWQSAVVVIAIIVTLILKPSGLFGKQKELEERV